VTGQSAATTRAPRLEACRFVLQISKKNEEEVVNTDAEKISSRMPFQLTALAGSGLINKADELYSFGKTNRIHRMRRQMEKPSLNI
jgi:hypothetical protein